MCQIVPGSHLESPPMRGRGLKLESGHICVCYNVKSPPMRGRGLKQYRPVGSYTSSDVAPHAGAWIETPSRVKWLTGNDVAPHAGAWIET